MLIVVAALAAPDVPRAAEATLQAQQLALSSTSPSSNLAMGNVPVFYMGLQKSGTSSFASFMGDVS
jgi:hypothetical protein